MKKLLTGLLVLFCFSAGAQTIVFDPGHFQAVNENAAVRLAGEMSASVYLKNINSKLDDISLNLNAVLLVEDIVHRSLMQVDEALKSGLMLKQIVQIGSEISAESTDLLELAKSSPHLLLFAQNVGRQSTQRAIRLAAEVSDFVLKEGDNVLMDFEKRDALLKKIVLELKNIRAQIYTMHKSMYYAKLKGLFRALNPYQGFINNDLNKAGEILFSSKLLKK